jgi:transposase
MEELRTLALSMLRQGRTQAGVARDLGVDHPTVHGWKRHADRHGEADCIRDARRAGRGRAPLLSEDEQSRIRRIVSDSLPEDNGLDYPLWTRAAVSDLCAKPLGKVVIIRTINNYLKKWGFTPQAPVRRAREQDPVAVKQWLEVDHPAIEAKAAQEGALILWCDETGVSNQANVCRGYAPRGFTPEIVATAKRHTRSVISAISNRGDMRWMVYKGGIKVPLLLSFLARLVKSMKGRKVHLIWDNLRVHHGKEVKSWLSTRTEEIEANHLPPYSPQIQPDERLNRSLKGELSRLPVPRDDAGAFSLIKSRLAAMQRNRTRVASFFSGPLVAYAARK